MSLEQDSFDQVRRVLALKRYETPPPGYFNDFSRSVVARIERLHAHERSAGAATSQPSEAGWLVRLWEALETKPLLAGAFGMVACGLLVGAVVYSEVSGNRERLVVGSPQDVRLIEVAGGKTDTDFGAATLPLPETASPSITGTPSLDAGSPSLFDQIGAPRIEPISFAPGGN
jgi:hypothetical protein